MAVGPGLLAVGGGGVQSVVGTGSAENLWFGCGAAWVSPLRVPFGVSLHVETNY
jgi:hypothetical protein